jgi:hypothetical protein
MESSTQQKNELKTALVVKENEEIEIVKGINDTR